MSCCLQCFSEVHRNCQLPVPLRFTCLLSRPRGCACAELPFDKASEDCPQFASFLRDGVVGLLGDRPGGLLGTVSPQAVEVVAALLSAEPADRPTVAELRKLEWFTGSESEPGTVTV